MAIVFESANIISYIKIIKHQFHSSMSEIFLSLFSLSLEKQKMRTSKWGTNSDGLFYSKFNIFSSIFNVLYFYLARNAPVFCLSATFFYCVYTSKVTFLPCSYFLFAKFDLSLQIPLCCCYSVGSRWSLIFPHIYFSKVSTADFGWGYTRNKMFFTSWRK